MSGSQRKERSRIAPVVTAIATAAFLALLVYGVTARSPDERIDQQLADGQAAEAPPLALPLFASGNPRDPRTAKVERAGADGQVRLEELEGPTVLNFWASWCVPCADEAPILEAAWKRSRDVLFLGVNQQDLTDDAGDFLERHDISFPSVRDRGDYTGRSWGVTGLPETFFLDRRGMVVGHVIGALDAEKLAAGMRAARDGRILGGVRGGDRRPVR